MKKTLICLTAFFISAVSCLNAQNLSGYDIMKKADEVPGPKTSSSTAILTIHSKKGSDRVREVIMKSKDYGDVSKEVIVFTTPNPPSAIAKISTETISETLPRFSQLKMMLKALLNVNFDFETLFCCISALFIAIF